MAHSQKSPSRSPRGTKKQPKLVRLPYELAEGVTEASEQLGISANEFHVRAVAGYLQALRAPAPEHAKADDAETKMEAQYRIAEVLGEMFRGIVKTEIEHAVDALAPRIASAVTAGLTPLRSEIASALSGGLRTIQGQVENLIADSILSNAVTSSRELDPALEPSALRPGLRTTEHSKLAEPVKDEPSVQAGAEIPAAINNQQSLAALARRAQTRVAESRPSSSAARSFRKSGG